MIKPLIFISLALLAQTAFAAPLTYTYSPPIGTTPVPVDVNGGCSTSSVTMTSMVVGNGPRIGTNVVGGGVNATSCLGYVTSPNNDWGKDPAPNTGDLYDGILNGQLSNATGKDKIQYYVDPNTFLTNDNDRWLAEGRPGWIAVAGADCAEGEETCGTSNPDENNWYKSVEDINIGSFLDVTFGNGWWSLKVTDIGALLAAEEKFIGGSSTYDHLTFVFKGANSKDKTTGVSASWAIFDFNFYDLIDDFKADPLKGADIRFDEFYSFAGTWDTGVIGGQALSHWSIWVHDPPLRSSTSVPTPASLLLIIPGLALMLMMRRRRF